MTQTKSRMRLLALGLAGAALALATVGVARAISTNSLSATKPAAAGNKALPEPGKTTPANVEVTAPTTPREFYNAGTEQLHAGKLREAETFLESTVASQQEKLQAPALYNLGHVRFAQGIEVLKKSPPAGPTIARGRAAEQQADEAIRKVEDALNGNDVDKLVAAYMHGRGKRKELKSALAAVRQAMTLHGAALARWQRSSGDFTSVVELKTKDADAQYNAEVVDRCIAKLVDSLQQMQKCANGMCDKQGQLGDKLKQAKGRIPGKDVPPGAAGDDDEDEDFPMGPQPGQEEGPTKEGKEMTLSQEQAGWVLDGFKLDSERRLPMGGTEPAQPKDRARPTW
jgi:hypothetical protein